jgi:hypothetical protein
MGTNYYLKVNHCKECDRHDLIHIGKQSWGWAFIFENIYPTMKIWHKVIQSKKAVIVDEYHEKVTKKEFWKMVAETKGKTNLFTYEGERNRYEENPEKHEYIDPDGYRFGKGEFS